MQNQSLKNADSHPFGSQGYSTVETVFAVGVLGITVTTSLQLGQYAHQAQMRARDTLQAITIAENTIEKLRSDNRGYTDQVIPIDAKFTEYHKWQSLAAGHQVTVTVEWQSAIGVQRVEIGTYVP